MTYHTFCKKVGNSTSSYGKNSSILLFPPVTRNHRVIFLSSINSNSVSLNKLIIIYNNFHIYILILSCLRLVVIDYTQISKLKLCVDFSPFQACYSFYGYISWFDNSKHTYWKPPDVPNNASFLRPLTNSLFSPAPFSQIPSVYAPFNVEVTKHRSHINTLLYLLTMLTRQ
jgi:hypothetical protein